jgi:hypothetical protein
VDATTGVFFLLNDSLASDQLGERGSDSTADPSRR